VRHFNTKKVRLKPFCRGQSFIHKNKFQYQKGAIKTGTLCLCNVPSALNFNTKKVRLKLRCCVSATRGTEGFQYQKGAIKTLEQRGLLRAGDRFQYQKGAIKTDACPGEGIGGRLISIPKRCD